MALLIYGLDTRIGNAKAWRDTVAEKLPDLELRIWPDAGELADIEVSRLHAAGFRHPPRLS